MLHYLKIIGVYLYFLYISKKNNPFFQCRIWSLFFCLPIVLSCRQKERINKVKCLKYLWQWAILGKLGFFVEENKGKVSFGHFFLFIFLVFFFITCKLGSRVEQKNIISIKMKTFCLLTYIKIQFHHNMLFLYPYFTN